MPGGGGLEPARQARVRGASFVILTAYASPGDVYAVIKEGVSEYLLKDALEDLVPAIRPVAGGRRHFGPAIVDLIAGQPEEDPLNRLTGREAEGGPGHGMG